MAKKKTEDVPVPEEWAGDVPEITQSQFDLLAQRAGQDDLKRLIAALREHGKLTVV